MLPYFRRAETFEGGADAYHGADGPLHVSRAASRNPIYAGFIEAGVAAGHRRTQDFNGFQQEGFGPYQMTIRDGERWSASAAYLRPILGKRPNLAVELGARTTRILIEQGRAVGVEFLQDGATRQLRAEREVLLAAGAVQSPHILQLSGVGDPDRLKEAGVAVIHALKGVGENLQDHLDVILSWETPSIKTAYSHSTGLNRLTVGLNYMLFRQGFGRQQFLEAARSWSPAPISTGRPAAALRLAIMKNHGKEGVPKDGFSITSASSGPRVAAGSPRLGRTPSPIRPSSPTTC